MKKEIYTVTGMACAACSAAVERVTRKLDGMARADVNLTTGKLVCEYDESKVTSAMIMQKVEKCGFGISLDKPTEKKQSAFRKTDNKKEDSAIRKRLLVAGIFSILLLYVSMGPMLFSNLPMPIFADMNLNPFGYALTELLLCIPVLIAGKRFFISGYSALAHRVPNMDSLVAIGSSCSFLYSVVMMYLLPENTHYVHRLYFESAAVVITLVMFGKYLEAKSKRKTKSAIEKLMSLAPDAAHRLLPNGETEEVSTASLAVGDVILIKPGERVPQDATVLTGIGSVDESMLTGEPMPVLKREGQTVVGGSINKEGALTASVLRVGDDATLNRIIRFVEEAQGKKAPIAGLADKVAGVFVPSVMAIACLSALAWLIAGKDIAFVLKIFTSVLIIACPCALGLATPTAIMVGTGLGAANGILIRNGEMLEITHKVDTVVLDKTGTLTEGKPAVTDVLTNGVSETEVLSLAFSAEALSEHPLAHAVADYAQKQGVSGQKAEDFESLPGRGLRCRIGKSALVIGNESCMHENGIDNVFSREAAEKQKQGKTPLYVAENGKMTGLFLVSDTIKPTSEKAVAMLKKQGIRTIMLTGDTEDTARYIAAQAGVDEVIAGVLPEEKAGKIEALKKEGRTVMMVGDGINDAPALSASDVGVAIGSGSDIAIETGGIVLMKNDIADIPRAIRLSRLTIRNIKENLFWAFCYNTIGIPIAAGLLCALTGNENLLLSPMIGGFAMSLSSVFVVTNALRLRTKKL